MLDNLCITRVQAAISKGGESLNPVNVASYLAMHIANSIHGAQHSPAPEPELTAVVRDVVGGNDVPGATESAADVVGWLLTRLVALATRDVIRPAIHSRCSNVNAIGSSEDATEDEEDSMKLTRKQSATAI